MQKLTNRMLSLLLVLVMVISMVPAVFAAGEDASTAYAAENTTTGEKFTDLNLAIASAQSGQIVKVLTNAQDVAYSNAGVILDLNGHNLTNVSVAEGVTLSAIDSATDDYNGNFGTLTTEGQVAPTVKTAEPKSYVTLCENGNYSFHRYYASIASVILQPAKAALGYRAEFRADQAVKNALVEYGYELWVNDNAHKTYTRTDKLEKTSLTLRLNNLLCEGDDARNALGSTATIGGKAFMTVNLNGQQVTLYGAEQQTTLRQVIESVNANAGKFGQAQLESVRSLCTTYAPWMMGWATENIFSGNPGEGSDGLKVEIVVDVTAENGVLSQDATMTYGDISATVPAGTALENGVKQLVLTITEKAASDSDVTEGEGESLIPLDVHISGISADNTAPIVICLGDILPKGLNIGNYDLYHVENGQTVPMTRVYTVSELDSHNEFCYDPATGSVTVAMASFSEITLRSVETGTWEGKEDHTWYKSDATTLYIYNADQLWSLSQIVGGMAEGIEQDSFAGKTIVLYADINLNDGEEDGKIFYPIGYYNTDGTYEKTGTAISSAFKAFAGTFDGNGHTIANFYQNTWEMKGDHNWYDAKLQYYRDGMGLFGKVYGGTIKNLTVKNFSSDGEITTTGTIAAYADNGATFENISIFNCNPRVYNIGNGGIVGCVGWYNNEVEDKKPVTFKNITVDNTNKISALWGSYDVACGGLVGQYYPTSGQTNATKNAGIHMDNCHVSAQIDVYNDVCGNYMYYAYRYAGMLIGSVRENITGEDGRVYPKMDGITANACTVHYGEWNHYYYCEFVSNGHPSYAQEDEYKFSRVPESELVRDSEGKVIGCTHEHTDVEDNRAVYLPFYDQLVTGYGWGVTSKGIADIPGVTVLDRVVADSVVKFDKATTAKDSYVTGNEVTIGELFTAIADLDAKIKTENVQVTVSPVGDQSTAAGVYVANTTDWTKGTLIFSGIGQAEIIITDYYFCTETKLTVTLTNAAKIGDTEYASVQDALNAAQDGAVIELIGDVTASKYQDIYTPNNGEIERSITLDLNGNTITAAPSYKYAYYPLVFVGINQTLTIQNGFIIADEHVAIGAYGKVILDNVNVSVKNPSADEQAVCIWNWGTDDEYYQDCNLLLTGAADIKNCTIKGGILVEGPVTLDSKVEFDALYLNTKTGHGKVILPTGYGMVKENGYYTDLHEHSFNDEGTCTICNLAFFYEKTEPNQIDAADVVLITMTKGDTTWAMSNDNGTSDAPDRIEVIVADNKLTGNIAGNMQWNMVVTEDGYMFYPNGSNKTWLYSTNSNDGLRIGTGDAKHFTIENSYLKITETDEPRYLGVYVDTDGISHDWRSYKISGGYSNIKGQTLAFYVLKTNCKHDNINTEEREAIAATCTQAGREAGTYCLDCDSYTEGGALIPATGHTLLKDENASKAPTCTDNGKDIYRCSVCNKVKTETIKAIGHTETATTIDATCVADGSTTISCSVCDTVISTTKIPATGVHNYVNGTCSVCEAEEPTEPSEPEEPETVIGVLATFEFGTNGSSTHTDGSKDQTSYTELNNGYTLSITGASKMYPDSFDAKGNSCLKLGASGAAGSFKFTVPNEVTSVVIYVAKYKANTSKVTINGTTTTLSNSSNDGNYNAITVDTTTSKTVTLTTVSGGYRAMVNTIEFYGTVSGGESGGEEQECQHTNTTTTTVAPTCKDEGSITTTCVDCGATIKTEVLDITDDHKYDNGTCTVCGAKESTGKEEVTKKYTFSSFTAGTQYAKNEKHKLDEYITVTTNDCHFTNELRIYSSSSNNGYAIIQSENPITKIAVNAGNKVDTLIVYGSNDGSTWTDAGTISVTSTSYKDYELTLNGEYMYLKLDVKGSNQIRLKSMTLTWLEEN